MKGGLLICSGIYVQGFIPLCRVMPSFVFGLLFQQPRKPYLSSQKPVADDHFQGPWVRMKPPMAETFHLYVLIGLDLLNF